MPTAGDGPLPRASGNFQSSDTRTLAPMADAAVELLRQLPPDAVVDNLGLILGAQPDLAEELLSRVDQPLRLAHDGAAGRDYLLCDYNRDADSYRRAPEAHNAARC